MRIKTPSRLISPRLHRRHALAGFGVLGVSRFLPGCGSDDSSMAAPQTPAPGASGGEATCMLTPAQTEGPFFSDTGLERSDIRDGKTGAPLQLRLRVVDSETCSPIAGALVEVWHADAAGVYSAFGSAAGQTFLRGFQSSDASGYVEFLTVYPGWYPGRTPHIHLMVLLPNAQQDPTQLLTTQLYFPESVTDAVYALEPYAARGPRSTTNATDGVGVPDTLIGSVEELEGGLTTSFRLVSRRPRA